MGMFQTREPRRFRRVSIYTDENKERLQKLVDDVKREQGELPAEEPKFDPERFKGTFIKYTPRAERHRERSRRFGWPFYVVLIFALIILIHFLLYGIR